MSALSRLLLAAALLAPLSVVPSDAEAAEYLKCAKKDDPKKKAKCNKNYGKWLAKEKGRTQPYKPSMLNDKLADWDADDKNPFATDDWYMGTREIGLASLDELLAEVWKAQGLIKMAKYVGHIHKEGNKDDAKHIAGIILPDLVKLKDILPTLQEKLAAVQADLPNIAKDNPALIIPAGKAITQTIANLGKLPADLPGALAAVVPLVKGAPAAAKTMAVDAVEDAVTGKAKGKKR